MQHIGNTQRRARIALRQRLAPVARSNDPAQIARDVVGLHATDPATLYLAVAVRSRDVSSDDVAHALHDARTLVRLLAMRRTMFALPLDLAPVAFAACTRAIAARERKRLVKQLQASGVKGDASRWLARVQDETVAALDAAGEATGSALSEAVTDLQTTFDNPYGGPTRITTQVLNLLAAEGRIVRGRTAGGLTSSRHHWAPLQRWLPGGLEARDPGASQAELVGAWLARYGPGTLVDLQWWTGLTRGQTRAALKRTGAVTVRLDNLDGGSGDPVDPVEGYVLPDDTVPVKAPRPWAALLPALDPTAMGYKQRGFYLGDHREPLFDRSGNIGPTVWWAGRIVGGWAQRADGRIAVRLLEKVSKTGCRAIDERVAFLEGWLGDTRVKPRFRTPLERALSA